MKKLLLLTAFCFTFLPAMANPAGQLKVSLWGPAALASPGNIDEVSGFDFGLLGTTTQRMDGFQLAPLYAHTPVKLNGLSIAVFSHARDTDGMQLGAFTLTDRDMWGVQMGAINITQQSVRGVQLGALNYAWYIRGVQLALVNHAHRVKGVQLGLINHADQLKGVQLGVINIAKNGYLPAMVVLNARF